jgi:hypothetical protein
VELPLKQQPAAREGGAGGRSVEAAASHSQI